jgi:LacI family transcriptional regulator
MATTIADVARRAGVSTATVSRVLSGVGRATPGTHARVEAAARELDYRPSDVARSLKRRSTLTLGLIITDIENPYFPQLVRGVEDAANAEGYTVLLCNATDDPEREASYLDLLVERRVDGLIIAASEIGSRQGAWLATAPLPVVLINTSAATSPGVPTIVSDNRAGGRSAARHLLDLGHVRFGYLLPPPRNVDAPERLGGVRDELAAAGAAGRDVAPLAIGRGLPSVAGGETAMLDLLEQPRRPTAVIAYNDLMAIGAMRAIRRRGLAVPTDVSIVGFDDVAFAAYAEPPLTTVRQETAEMGRWAVATVTERIKATHRGEDRRAADRRIVPVELTIRGSTAPVPVD